MATVYPTQKDSWAEAYADQPITAGYFNNLNDAIVALETKVGVNNSSVNTSMDYKVNNMITASTCMYFYEDTAPTGWTATLLSGDMIVSTYKPGGVDTDFYKTPQTASGNWELLYDTGSGLASEWSSVSHNHQWMSWEGGLNYSYQSDGWKVRFGAYVRGGSGIITTCSGEANCYLTALDLYTNNINHTHEWGAAWRPSAAIGIIAQYTGA